MRKDKAPTDFDVKCLDHLSVIQQKEKIIFDPTSRSFLSLDFFHTTFLSVENTNVNNKTTLLMKHFHIRHMCKI